VKFLIDQQLPPALAAFICSKGHTAQHCRDIGLKEADDRTVWRHASANNLIVISKDEDFYILATIPGNQTKFLWIRVGNCRNKALLEIMEKQFPNAIAAFESGALIVEIQ